MFIFIFFPTTSRLGKLYISLLRKSKIPPTFFRLLALFKSKYLKSQLFPTSLRFPSDLAKNILRFFPTYWRLANVSISPISQFPPTASNVPRDFILEPVIVKLPSTTLSVLNLSTSLSSVMVRFLHISEILSNKYVSLMPISV